MDVSVVVVNWNAGGLLAACLRRVVDELGSGEGLAGECLVVDNASDPGDLEAVRRELPSVRVVLNDRNLGFARAANRGIRETGGRSVMLLNPDALLTPGSLRHLVGYLRAHPRVGVVGPRITDVDGAVQGSARSFPGLLTAFFGRTSVLTRRFPGNPWSRRSIPALGWRADAPLSVDWVSGACCLTRREALEGVGGLDEGFFLYWEDADLCWRIRAAGWDVVYDPRVSVVHVVGASSRRAPVRAIVAFHRSAYRLYRKHVTRARFHPLNLVAIAGLFCRASGLVLAAAMRGRRRPPHWP